jgi:hypothetical protein
MAIPFIATEVSGLTDPGYPSAATSRKWTEATFAATGHTHDGMASTWTWNTPTTSSGLSVAGTGKVSGSLEIFIDDYIASSTALSKFVGSSAFDTWRSNVDQTEMSYLDGVTSDIQTQIDTKLFNNADDETTGVITAHGFIGALSGAKISANIMLFSGTQINAIFDEDDMSSDADDALATQQSIKKYVDDNVGGSSPSSWTAPTAVSGIQLAGVGKMSGALSIGIVDYIASTNALANFAGSTQLGPVRKWYIASAQALSAYQASGDEWSAAYDWYTASSAKLGDFAASGDEYSAAYASAQALQDGAFIKVATGWFNVSDQSAIPHTLGARPKFVSLTPSGNVTYATSYTADATNIHVRVSHAGQRTLNWRAEV